MKGGKFFYSKAISLAKSEYKIVSSVNDHCPFVVHVSVLLGGRGLNLAQRELNLAQRELNLAQRELNLAKR